MVPATRSKADRAAAIDARNLRRGACWTRDHVQDNADRLLAQRRSESALYHRLSADSGVDRSDHGDGEAARSVDAEAAAGRGGHLRYRFRICEQQLESGHDVLAAQAAFRTQ